MTNQSLVSVMLSVLLKLLIFWSFIINAIEAIVPPEYFIQLEVTDTFIISDMFDSDDAEDFSNDDMNIIKRSELSKMIKPGNEKKYYMLHELAERKNREALENEAKSTTPQGMVFTKSKEYFYDFDDEPVYVGFMDPTEDESVNKKQNKDHSKEILNKKSESNPNKRKRDYDYNYDKLKHDYDANAEKVAKSKDVMKYVEVTEKEGLKDSAKNIVKFKTTKNCTAEEMKGIGLNAMRCFFKDFAKVSHKSKAEKKNFFTRLLKMILIWLLVYVVIAVPCWCTRGWCCCCCRCKFCKPKKTIEAAKKFLADNPVGVLHIEGKKVTYTPTAYEHYAQQRLEKVVMKL